VLTFITDPSLIQSCELDFASYTWTSVKHKNYLFGTNKNELLGP